MACGILVPQPGIEPRPSAVRVQSPNHWAAREFPDSIIFSGKNPTERSDLLSKEYVVCPRQSCSTGQKTQNHPT